MPIEIGMPSTITATGSALREQQSQHRHRHQVHAETKRPLYHRTDGGGRHRGRYRADRYIHG